MKENEFDLDFDFEKEYGFDLKDEDKTEKLDDDFDLRAILESDFAEEAELFNAEYQNDFNYDPEEYPLEEEPVAEPEPAPAVEEPAVAEEPEVEYGFDGGKSFGAINVIEAEETRGYAYPAIFKTNDGRLLLAYCRGDQSDGNHLCRIGIAEIEIDSIE
jgi:hypothetical protein